LKPDENNGMEIKTTVKKFIKPWYSLLFNGGTTISNDSKRVTEVIKLKFDNQATSEAHFTYYPKAAALIL
jgi:hypothetical protein